jgi:hypothetical protein
MLLGGLDQVRTSGAGFESERACFGISLQHARNCGWMTANSASNTPAVVSTLMVIQNCVTLAADGSFRSPIDFQRFSDSKIINKSSFLLSK